MTNNQRLYGGLDIISTLRRLFSGRYWADTSVIKWDWATRIGYEIGNQDLLDIRRLGTYEPGINQIKPLPLWAYCEIPGYKGVRIRKERRETIVLCAQETSHWHSEGRSGLDTGLEMAPTQRWFPLPKTICEKQALSAGSLGVYPVEHILFIPIVY